MTSARQPKVPLTGARHDCKVPSLPRCLSHILHGGQDSDVAAPEAVFALGLLVDEQKGDRDVLGKIFRDDISTELLWGTTTKREKERKTFRYLSSHVKACVVGARAFVFIGRHARHTPRFCEEA